MIQREPKADLSMLSRAFSTERLTLGPKDTTLELNCCLFKIQEPAPSVASHQLRDHEVPSKKETTKY